MAILQISQITQRKGLNDQLPQLAGAELGWSVDTRQLYIGNGTLAEGAPVVGNTEILTEFSDILNFNTTYTYKGQAAGYTVQTGPTPGTPVVQSLQSWMDQWASVKDFGAVGDGQTDDTAAINRALDQLYCQDANPQVRRSLFFPAGVYNVSNIINIPTWANLYGEGINNSVIALVDGSGVAYVAQTADSLQQTGNNIGLNGATPPQGITITNMGFASLDSASNVFLVQSAKDCEFRSVSFVGVSDVNSDADDTVSVEFGSTSSLITTNIVFDGCSFTGSTWAVNTDTRIKAVTFSNGKFDGLFQGILLGTDVVTNGPTGIRIVGNMFDNIYQDGIVFGAYATLNASGHNMFYDVGNRGTSTPADSIISILGNNNVSISDLFQRSDINSVVHPRVAVGGGTVAIATTNGSDLTQGSLTTQSGLTVALLNNTNPGTAFTLSSATVKSFKIDYAITRNLTVPSTYSSYRTGTLWITPATNPAGSTALNYAEDYTENSDIGITFSVTQTGTTVSVRYVSTNGGNGASLTYSVSYFK